MPQVDRLDPDEFNARATRLMMQGLVKPETYRNLIGQNRQARRDDAPASAYRSGRSFVAGRADPGKRGGRHLRGPAGCGTAERAGRFRRLSAFNPAASREQAVERARPAPRYQVTADTGKQVGDPAPLRLPGRARPGDGYAMRAPPPERLRELRRTGRMTPDEAQRNLRAGGLTAILAREAAAPSPPPATTPAVRGGGVNTAPRAPAP